jgi:NAD(P)H-dependent FMN reductase
LRDFLPTGVELAVFARLDALPVFSPDAEGADVPVPVSEFLELVLTADGIIISSPVYVRVLPGGLKNAID